MKPIPKHGYFCGIAWDHEVGEDIQGIYVYPTIRALKALHPMWRECGIVKVEFKLVKWMVKQNLTKEQRRER